MLVSKVGCDLNVWNACERKLEEECLFHHWRGSNQTTNFKQQYIIWVRTMTRLQNSGAGGCGSTESGVQGYYEN
jgi:hypothetical protein